MSAQEKARLQEQKDKADMQLPNQGEGFMLSNTGTDAKFVEAREQLEREKEEAKNRPAVSKNKWVGPAPQQRGMPLNPVEPEPEPQIITESPEETKQSQPRPGKFTKEEETGSKKDNNNNNNKNKKKD